MCMILGSRVPSRILGLSGSGGGGGGGGGGEEEL